MPYPHPLSDLHSLSQSEALELAQTEEQKFADLLQGHTPDIIQVTVVPKVRAEVNFKVRALLAKKKSSKKQKNNVKTDSVKRTKAVDQS